MVTIKIYIEGGGEGKDLDIRFREAWTKFFKAAGLSGRMPRPVRGKGRAHTFDLFRTAVQNNGPGEVPLLLLDSEDAVAPDHSVWQHLKNRDGWDKPGKVTEDHAYLMVQVMETWLIADPNALNNYFGHKFKSSKIPARSDLEAQPKAIVLDVLEKSTADCDKKQYEKGKISFELLGIINPQLVADKCPHAKRLLTFLAKER